jgi:hypothetical protein
MRPRSPTLNAQTRAFRRTAKGQAVALQAKPSGLSAEQHKLLLLINGFTPVETLAQLAHLQSPPDVLIDALTAHGLITDEPALTAMH